MHDRPIARRRSVPLLPALLCWAALAPAGAMAAACDGSGTFACPYTGAPTIVQHYGPASLRLPSDVAVDGSGNTWVASFGRNQVQEFDAAGNPVALTTPIGNADGTPGSGNQELHAVSGVGVDAAGHVYAADTNNNRVMEYDAGGTFVKQFGDGVQGTTGSHLSLPIDVAVDAADDVFVAVRAPGHNEIVEFDASGAVVRRFGTFSNVAGIAVAGTHVYATDNGDYPGHVKVFTTAGDAVTQFDSTGSSPHGIAVDAGDTEIAVAAYSEIRLYDTAGVSQGTVTSVGGPGSGDGQFSTSFALDGVSGVAFDGADLVVTDQGNARVQEMTTAGVFVAKMGGPSDGEMWRPGGVALGAGGTLVVADTGFNRLQTFNADGSFAAKIGRNGGDGSDGKAAGAEFSLPDAVAVDAANGDLYVADTENHQIVRLGSDGAYLGTLDPANAGDPLTEPHGVAVDATKVYVADSGHHRILVLDKGTGSVVAAYTTGAGGGNFRYPQGVSVTSGGDLWVADPQDGRVQVRRSDGTWSSYTGGSGGAALVFPTDVAVDENDGVAWVTDAFNSRVEALSLSTGALVTMFGTVGSAPGQLEYPEHLSYDAAGNRLLVADTYNDRIQVFTLGALADAAPTVALTAPADGAYTPSSPDFAGTAGDGSSDAASVHVEVHARNPLTGVSDPTDLGFDVTRTGTSFAGQLDKRLPDGVYVARAIQNAGQPNEGVSNAVTFNVDTTAPSPTVTGPADGGNSEDLRPTISGSAGEAPGDSAHLTVEVRQGGQRKSLFTVTRSGSSWSGQVPDALDPGGTFTVTVSQTDAAGHTGTSAASTFTTYARPVNTAAPTLAGAGTVGSTMTGSIGTWDYHGQIRYLVIWGRCPDLVPEHCVQVGGGVYPDGLGYTVSGDDIGSRLLLEVVAINPAGQFVAYSSFSGIVADPNAPAGTNGVAAGSPKVKPPPLTHTPAQASSTCQRDLYFGPVGVHADCFKRVGLTWEAAGTVQVNGLTLEPKGGAKVVIDPMNLRIATHGTVAVVAGPATVGTARIGPFTLYENSFDWVMQPNVTLPDAKGLATAIPGFGGGSLPSLGALSDLPGLASLASLPRLPDGLPDFSKVAVGDLKNLRIPTLDDARMQIPAFYLPVTQLPAIGIDTGAGAALFGLPVQGKLAMRLVNDGIEFNAALGLPQLGNLSAAAAFKVFNDGRFQLDGLKAHADEVNAGFVDLRPVDLQFNGPQNLWEGTASAYLPFPGSPGLGASASVKDGKLKKLGLDYDGNLALGPSGVFLSHLDFLLDDGPPTQFTSNVSLTAGPKLPALPPAFSLDGKFIYQSGDPAAYAFTGDAKLVGHPLASAGLEYHTNGYFHAFGRIGFHVGPNDAFGVEGSVDGWATKIAFEVDGTLGVTAPGGFRIQGKGLVSSLGIAACGDWNGLSAGAGYRWGGDISFFGGCGFSGFHPSKATAAAAQAGARTVQVPAGATGASFAIRGTGAAPKVVLSGPNGLSVTTPPTTLDALRDDRFLLVQNPGDDTTYILVARPPAGAWSISTEPGSAPIAEVQQADPLPGPHVRASVTGSGMARRLRWTLTPITGQKVRFVERSGGVARVLGETNAASGAIAFAPADGPGGLRRVEAVVEQDGLVREVDRVAGYRAPKPRRLAAPRRVRLAVRNSRLAVRWMGVRGAARYRVYATVNGGSKVLLAPKGHALTAAMAGVFADAPVVVRVCAIDAAGREGAMARASRRPPKVRKAKLAGVR